ncbi:MAG: DNA-binding protein WhiA [Bacilli bacterium]
MSFTSTVKDEVTRLETSKLEDISELSAIIRVAATINNTINITVENNTVARRTFKLVKKIYSITPSITVRNKKLGKGFTYILNIKNQNKEILEDLSIIDNNKYLPVPKEYIISDEEQLRAYLRGVFIVSGSVNDPKTSRYHLEFILDTKDYATFISNLLNSYNLNSKIIKREKNYTVYIKEAEKISDFLRIIKAFSAVMYFEDIRIYRDHKNMTNRLNNCEQANTDKIFMTASKQVKDIEKLYELGMVDLLDEKLKVVIEYRMKYRESSLQELADIISLETGVEITKSGLNHRFRKIKEILERVDNKKAN